MKKLKSFLIVLFIGLSAASLWAQAKIESFSLSGDGNTFQGVITEGNISVDISGDFFGDLKSLTPNIVVSTGATVTPASGIPQDFTKFVFYTVTAPDGSQELYKVDAMQITSSTVYAVNDRYAYLLIKRAGVTQPDPGYKIVATNMSDVKIEDFTLDVTKLKDKTVISFGEGYPTKMVDDLLTVGADPYGLDICYKETDLTKRVISQSVLVNDASFLEIKKLSKDFTDGVDYILSSELLCCIDYNYNTGAPLPEQPKQAIINAINILKKDGEARFYWAYHINGTMFIHPGGTGIDTGKEIPAEPYAKELKYYESYKKIMEDIVAVKPNIKYLLMHDTGFRYGLFLLVINK